MHLIYIGGGACKSVVIGACDLYWWRACKSVVIGACDLYWWRGV